MNNREIATALTNATEVEKAEFAQVLSDALVPLGLEDSAEAKRQIVAALDDVTRWAEHTRRAWGQRLDRLAEYLEQEQDDDDPK